MAAIPPKRKHQPSAATVPNDMSGAMKSASIPNPMSATPSTRRTSQCGRAACSTPSSSISASSSGPLSDLPLLDTVLVLDTGTPLESEFRKTIDCAKGLFEMDQDY